MTIASSNPKFVADVVFKVNHLGGRQAGREGDDRVGRARGSRFAVAHLIARGIADRRPAQGYFLIARRGLNILRRGRWGGIGQAGHRRQMVGIGKEVAGIHLAIDREIGGIDPS